MTAESRSSESMTRPFFVWPSELGCAHSAGNDLRLRRSSSKSPLRGQNPRLGAAWRIFYDTNVQLGSASAQGSEFDVAPTRTTLFGALLDARDRYGRDQEALEDPERSPLTYARLVLAALVLGR